MHPQLQSLLTFWDHLRGDRPAPSRSDFTPADLKHWLGNINLVDLEPSGIRVRLHGTMCVMYDGADFTGRYLQEVIPPEVLDVVVAPYRELQASSAPVHHRIPPGVLKGTCQALERLILPLNRHSGIDAAIVAIYVDGEPDFGDLDLYGRPRTVRAP